MAFYLLFLLKVKKSMNTEECLEFLILKLSSKNKNYKNETNHWICLKKYKNFKGETCRDFYNEKRSSRMIVVNNDKNEMSLIENQNFLYFLRQQEVQPLFCYAPFLSNYGTVFLFCVNRDFNRDKKINTGSQALIELLLTKIKTIFLEKNIFYLQNEQMVLIKNYDLNYIAEKLEQNNFKLNTLIFDVLKKPGFQSVFPDIMSLKYHFPEDDNKNSKEALDAVFFILSKQYFSEEIHVRIKKLIKKVPAEDLRLSKKIAIDLNRERKQEIKSLFENEIKNKEDNY